jgi:hypothetical protein
MLELSNRKAEQRPLRIGSSDSRIVARRKEDIGYRQERVVTSQWATVALAIIYLSKVSKVSKVSKMASNLVSDSASAHTFTDQFCGAAHAEREKAARTRALSRGSCRASARSYGAHAVGSAVAAF